MNLQTKLIAPILSVALLILSPDGLFAQSSAPSPYVSLKADAITNAGPDGSVSDWENAGTASAGFDANARPDTAPRLVQSAINNLPAVHFNAAQHQFLSIKRPVQDDFSIVCVFRSTQGIGDGPAFFGGAGLVQGEVPGVVSDFGMSLNSLGQVAVGTGLPDVSFASPKGNNDGKPHIAIMTRVKSTGLVSLYVDGILTGTVTGGTESLVSPARLGIGAFASNGANLDGDIAEIDIYDTALTDSQIKLIETALGSKWGVR